MGKATEPPKCKACGENHWGTCLDHSSRGYLSSRAEPAPPEVRAQRIAKADEIIGETKPKPGKVKPARKPRAAKPKATAETKTRGRPKSITDMKAYKAQKARERRAAKKPTT